MEKGVLKPENNSGLNGIRTHDLCDTGKIDKLSIRKILNLVLKIKGSLMVELPTQDMRQAREGFFT